MRQLLLVVVCLGVLLFPALSSSAVQRSNVTRDGSTGPLGIVPPQIPKSSVRPSALVSPDGPTISDNLTYQGGPIMPTTTNYAIYWVPSGYSIPSNYKAVIDGYFTNVAAATGGSSNVYAASTQYFDSSNYIRYSATFGGSAIDTQPFPASGCTNPSDVIDATKCLSDNQLRAEVQRFAAAQGWPHGPNVEFFLYTAANVGSCDGNQCAYDVYCAYHSEFTSNGGEYIYANMPYSLQPVSFSGVTYASDCMADGQGHPNAVSSPPTGALSAADYDLSVTSHESNESITDPLGTAWWVNNGGSLFAGSEDGDLCAWYFPDEANLGGNSSDGSLYNQAINGGHYFLQGEWSNDSATGTANSGCTWSFSGSVPANSSTPSVTGTPTVGQVLTGNPGSWTGSPTRYWYIWQRCDSGGGNCSPISSSVTASTTPSYTLTNADTTHTIRLMVGGANSAGAGTGVQSSATGVITGLQPANTSAPTINGTATVGQLLTGNAGTWTNSPTKYTYVWQRCDSGGANCTTSKTIANSTATSPTYTLAASDDKHTIRLSVTAINAAGSTAPQITAATSVVNGEPVYSSGFSLTGTATVGQTLTAQAGTWSLTPTKYTYTWQRCDSGGANCATSKTLAGTSATSATYKLVTADDKHTIVVSVFALNAAGSGTPQTSAATSVVNGEPVYSSGFSLTGTATVGQTLTAQAGTWSLTPTKYTYTWQRCDSGGANCATFKTLAGTSATSATYKLVTADDKHTIVVSVFALNAAGSGTPQTSAATSVVNGEPVNTASPSITGTPTVGQTLTAQAGTWSPSATKYSYLWQRCDSGGSNCTTITTISSSSATTSYKLIAVDQAHTIKVTVTATNNAGASVAEASSATNVVA